MNNEGDFLKGLAMRSSEAATGIPTRMRACSISTTTTPTIATTTSASADPRKNGLDAGDTYGRLTLGRKSPGAKAPKARQHAQPETAAMPTGGAVECGSDFHHLTSLPNLFTCWLNTRKDKSHNLRIQRFSTDPLRHLITTKLAGDGLTIHPHKIRLAPVSAGIPFLGYVVWPKHISAGHYIRSRYHQRLRQHESGGRDRIDALRSYQAMLNHTGSTR